ncbi:MAG: hypothetical protein ACLQU1_28910 [Bryobacteraceae bacterium]
MVNDGSKRCSGNAFVFSGRIIVYLADAENNTDYAEKSTGYLEIFSALPDYYVWAFDRVDLNALSDADFVRNLVSLAETLRVARGEVAAAPNLKVTPWPE